MFIPCIFVENFAMVNQAVENYLKCIYALSQSTDGSISTNAIAARLDTKASSVTDMLKKLKTRDLAQYEKYKGVSLTSKGEGIAIEVVRKHRLWEVFLVDKLKFGWQEVHDIAEELEHIESVDLVERLDEFLGFPKFDPHGDPIPDAQGNFQIDPEVGSLTRLLPGDNGVVVGVKDSSTSFLIYLQEVNLVLGAKVEVRAKYDFDHSIALKIADREIQVSAQVSENLLIKKLNK